MMHTSAVFPSHSTRSVSLVLLYFRLVVSLFFQVKLGKQIQKSIVNGRKGLLGKKSHWLYDVPGTSAWWAWQRQELAAQREWRGPPLFFLTTSCSTMTNDLMGTFLTGKAKRSGEVLDIWTGEDENKQFSVLPERQPPPLPNSGHFVHSPSKDGVLPDCPFYLLCTRTPLGQYRDRYVPGMFL